ncbi:MAG: pyridoxamine 5'-phosphate oxidase family protein [Methanosarcinales archaeon]|nr:pyridoxamine 5'-phosphate oxidase family protein [Methanosarcinales archaeon]
MEYLPAYIRILKQGGLVALATSVNDSPNVRIVNYCCDENNPSVIYFSTTADSDKIAELGENDKTAFTTIPNSSDDVPHVRSHSASVRKSDLSLNDVKDLFLEHYPGLAEMYETIGDALTVYEIHVKEADVIVDMENFGKVTF